MSFGLNQSFGESVTIGLDFGSLGTWGANPDYVIVREGTHNYKTAPSKLIVGNLVSTADVIIKSLAISDEALFFNSNAYGPSIQVGNDGRFYFWEETQFGTVSRMNIGFNHAYASGAYYVDNLQVVGNRQSAISNCGSEQTASTSGTLDGFGEVDAKVNAILTALRNHGLITT